MPLVCYASSFVYYVIQEVLVGKDTKQGREYMQILIRWKTGLRWLVLLFICSCLCVMFLPAQARAATGVIADDAHVLDSAAVQQYTDPFSYTVNIFTTRVFRGSDADFDKSVQGLANYNPSDSGPAYPCDPTQQIGCELFTPQTLSGNTIPGDPTPTATPPTVLLPNYDPARSVEIGIDVPARHLAIFAGQSVTLPQDHYENAIQAFAAAMHQSQDNYTQATIAALNALQSASDRFWNGVHAALPWIFLGALLLVLIIFAIVARALGWNSGNSSGYGWRNYNNYNNWDSGGGGGFGGGDSGSGGGGGGGGASGNF
jgi:hypothetical protein